MKRKIIRIDEEKCNGCGLCVNVCQEGAIALIDGKAKLVREDYCDGLGNCLPACPMEAISFEEREAPAFNEHAALRANAEHVPAPFSGCPGSRARSIQKAETPRPAQQAAGEVPSGLGQWPCQIKLVPVNAPYFRNANLLIAADCTAYAFGNFHNRFMRNRITLIGCPKLDEGDYAEKLTAILSANEIKSVTIVRMEVPCCGGIVRAATEALRASGKMIPWRVVTIGVDGGIVGE